VAATDPTMTATGPRHHAKIQVRKCPKASLVWIDHAVSPECLRLFISEDAEDARGSANLWQHRSTAGYAKCTKKKHVIELSRDYVSIE
jgi:hypothetical protein